ncbi:prepilin peptidase [Caminibacter mediatlanticus TB-2]|uniref:Prepilin peptidase n=1 Tax=Caminibacter mediatlanticus TB-2 TaxID=391592 RepID=A0ABX5V9S1_9BACT|nr:A24 family peptidase [Caminibacter mediatlanticus]QCT95045.1 prepilin peptidase [Caminibacter mediatlanticus TB-2]
MENCIIYIFLFLLGICVGSFLNVLIYRLPLNKSIISPPSSCPNCNTKIKPWHNIPIFSWIFLKGKCAYCKEKISIRYPIIEFLTGILAVLIYLKMKNIDIFYFTTFATFSGLLALAIIDIDYKAVPDNLNLLVLALSIFHSPNILENFKNALLVIGGMSIIRWYLSYFIKKEAMGEGDLIIGGVMGAMLGINLSLIAIFISAILAIIPSIYFLLQKKEPELPFIPFLALGTFIVWYFSNFFNSYWSSLYA